MDATADALSLTALVGKALDECAEVAKVYRIWQVYPPYDSGEATEVLFEGRLRGGHEPTALTAWLTCSRVEGGGFAPEVRVVEGW